MRRWWFSWLLLLAYLAAFHLWHQQPRSWVLATGVGITLLLSAVFAVAWKRQYFVNRWDALGHAAVILDVALESSLVHWHPDYSFYGCAAAFALVVGGYRARHSVLLPPSP